MKNFSIRFGAVTVLSFTAIFLGGCGTGLTNISSSRTVNDMKAEEFLHDLNWDTYTNAAKGVTFRYPKVVLDSQNPLCPTKKVIILEDGDWIYVAPEKATVAGQSCDKATSVTKENVGDYLLLAIVTGQAKDQTEVEAFLRKAFDAPECTVRSMTVFRDGPQQLVIRGKGCDNVPEDATILFHPDFKRVMAYPSKPNQRVFQTIDPQKQGFVRKDSDAEVWGSIAFVK